MDDRQRRAMFANLRSRRRTNERVADAFWAKKKLSLGYTPRGVRDKVYIDDGKVKARLWNTDIAEMTNGKVKLNTEGWTTPTTKNRLNAIIRPKGYEITQRNYRWYLIDPNGKEKPFEDGMEI